MYKTVNGKQIPLSEEEKTKIEAEWAANKAAKAKDIADNGYKYARAKAYPSVLDQLDALYHAMDQGVLPKVTGFYDELKAVKDANPKPGEE